MPCLPGPGGARAEEVLGPSGAGRRSRWTPLERPRLSRSAWGAGSRASHLSGDPHASHHRTTCIQVRKVQGHTQGGQPGSLVEVAFAGRPCRPRAGVRRGLCFLSAACAQAPALSSPSLVRRQGDTGCRGLRAAGTVLVSFLPTFLPGWGQLEPYRALLILRCPCRLWLGWARAWGRGPW